MKRMIFHHPLPIESRSQSASSLRPLRMLEAFKKIGYEVHQVTGYSKQRARSIRDIKEKLEMGESFDFLYSEYSTTPIMLCDEHHFPLRPFLDSDFFQYIRSHKIKVGVFYRDIHWRFPHFRSQVSNIKRSVLLPFFRLEAKLLSRTTDCLFLPSDVMRKELPQGLKTVKSYALPPGSLPQTTLVRDYKEPLRLLYVGGILPPSYDLRSVFEQLARVEGVAVKIICRENEWTVARDHYKEVPKHFEIEHTSGKDLDIAFERAHIFLNLYEDYPYRHFAFPYKVMEAIGWGLPLITVGRGPDSEFIERNHAGWRLNTLSELPSLIEELLKNKDQISKASQRAVDLSFKNTWINRAEEAVRALS